MKLTIEQQKNVNDNVRLVRFIASKYNSRFHTREDVESIGYIGLTKAAIAFDPSKGIKFATFATQCIKNEIGMEMRKEKVRVKTVSFDTPIGDDTEGCKLEDVVAVTDDMTCDNIEQQDDNDEVYKAINELPEMQRKIIECRYIKAYNQAKTSLIVGITQSYVCRVERKALDALRECLRDRL